MMSLSTTPWASRPSTERPCRSSSRATVRPLTEGVRRSPIMRSMSRLTPVVAVTRAQQRAGTRQAILDATVAVLIDEGYAALSTRRVAERAGIAQSTLMHHFPAREGFLVEAVTHLAERLNAEAVAQLNDLPSAAAVIDAGWAAFTSPAAVAAAQLWAAAWAEPELATALREAEERLAVIISDSAGAHFPHVAGQ